MYPKVPHCTPGTFDRLGSLNSDTSDSGKMSVDDTVEGVLELLLSLDGTDDCIDPPPVDNAGGHAAPGIAPNPTQLPPLVDLVGETINLPDTPSLQCTMGVFINKICNDLGIPSLSLIQMVMTLRDDLNQTRMDMAAKMTQTSRSLDGVLDILTTLVTRDGLHDMITDVIQKEVDCRLNTMRDSFTLDLGHKLAEMEANIMKLGDRVHSMASTLGHITNTKFPDLEWSVVGLTGPRPPCDPLATPPTDHTTTNPATPAPTPMTINVKTDPPQVLAPPTCNGTLRHLAPAASGPSVPSPVGGFHLHNSHFESGLDSDAPCMSATE